MANPIEVNNSVENHEQFTTANFNSVDILKSASRNDGGNDKGAAGAGGHDSQIVFTNIYPTDGSRGPGGSGGRDGGGGHSAGSGHCEGTGSGLDGSGRGGDSNRGTASGGGSLGGDAGSDQRGGGRRVGKTQDRVPSDGDQKAINFAATDRNPPSIDLSSTTVRPKDSPNQPALAPDASLLVHR